jgi:hypothetical protein
MKLDWQHVAIGVVGIGCATACIVLGKGDLLLKVLAGVGGLSGILAMFKSPPGLS